MTAVATARGRRSVRQCTGHAPEEAGPCFFGDFLIPARFGLCSRCCVIDSFIIERSADENGKKIGLFYGHYDDSRAE